MLRSLLKSCLFIVLFAVVVAMGFNLFMPQGLSALPDEVANPLWQAASAQEAKEQANAGAMLIDARPAGDFNLSRLRGAVKMPAEDLAGIYPLLADSIKQAPAVMVYGRSFSRFPAATVGQFLHKQGVAKVYVTEASLDDLQKAGFSLQEPRRRAE